MWVRIPAGGMDVYLMWVLCVVRHRSVRRADHSSRGVLPTVMRRCVWCRNLVNEEGLAHWGLSRQKQREKNGDVWGVEAEISLFCTSVLIVAEWTASDPEWFNYTEKVPDPYSKRCDWVGGCVGTTADLCDAVIWKKLSPSGIEPQVSGLASCRPL
jgi:hypothetical protein